MLATIDCEVNLCVAEILGLVIGKKEDGAIVHDALTSINTLLVFILDEVLVELDTGDDFALFYNLLRVVEGLWEVLCRVAGLPGLLYQLLVLLSLVVNMGRECD